MVITCENCGSDRFRSGELELDPGGGFTVVMPCAQCGTPNKTIHDQDPEFAKMLTEFFGRGDDGDTRFTHKLS